MMAKSRLMKSPGLRQKSACCPWQWSVPLMLLCCPARRSLWREQQRSDHAKPPLVTTCTIFENETVTDKTTETALKHYSPEARKVKTIAGTENENEFMVTLEVQTKQKLNETVSPPTR